jgi:hypothetical protein
MNKGHLMTVEQNLVSYSNTYDVSRNKVSTRLVLGVVWAFFMIVFAAIQLNLGTDEKIIAIAFIALLCCAMPLILFGIDDICAVFIFGLLAKYSFFPLWIKTLFGERIDIGLTSPFRTFEMAMVGSIVCCIALLLIKLIPVKRSLLNYRLNNQQMLLAGYLATAIGLFFLTMHVFLAPVILPSGVVTRGFGGFGSLIGPLYFGISCLTVISIKQKTRPIHKLVLLLVFLLIIVLSLQTNAKVEFTLAVFSFALTIFYFRIKIKAQYILYSCLFVVFYFFVFAPVIHLTRTETFKTADFSGKIAIIEKLFSSNSVLELQGQTGEIFNYDYYPNIHSFTVDRLEMIQDLDIAAGGISSYNKIDWIPVRWAFEAALPSFIVHNKSTVSDIDLIAYNAGYYPVLVTLNHTIGVFGSAYAMFLCPGLVFISMIIIFVYLLILRLVVSPKLVNNLFGIFLLARYVFTFSEQSVQALLITILRSIPIDAVLILGICILVFWILPIPRKDRYALTKR